MHSNIIITRKNIKRMYLRVNDRAQICISAPLNMSHHDIQVFVEKNSAWITRTQASRRQELKRKQQLQHQLPLLGVAYPIMRIPSQKDDIILDGEQCMITTRGTLSQEQSAHVEKKMIIEFYRKTLMPHVHTLVSHYAPIIGVTPNEVRSKNMKTKWGTCNTRDKRLWFNVQLARFSLRHIEYVVVHEMVHLKEASHNQRFYQLVAEAMPDWEHYHTQLKQLRC